MVSTAILSVIYSFISFMISLIPKSEGLPIEVGSSLTSLLETAYGFDYVIPIGTFVTVLIVAVGFHAGILAFHALMWIIRKIPGIN